MFRPRVVIAGLVSVVGLSIGLLALWVLSGPTEPPQVLRIAQAAYVEGKPGATPPDTNVIADDLRQKFASTKRVAFNVTASRGTSIFVLATGVQARTPAGWKVLAEEYRGEIWRLTNGIAHEVCVERPEAATWRAYVRYGTEMKRAALLRARLKEAWRTRSFANWTGKAWGGGRWSGSYELLSREIGE